MKRNKKQEEIEESEERATILTKSQSQEFREMSSPSELEALKAKLENMKSQIKLMEARPLVEANYRKPKFKPSVPAEFHGRKDKKALELWLFLLNNML
jgi:hypothetical protein